MKGTDATARRRTRTTRVDVQWGDGVAEGLADKPPPAGDLKRWAAAAIDGDDAAELCLRIVDEREIRDLNARYRDRDEVTNVLSFPCELRDEAGTRLLGDVVICAQRVCAEAAEQGKAPQAHWAHLVMHGVLHLLGHDHMEERERAQMEAREIALLADQGYANPYEITSGSAAGS